MRLKLGNFNGLIKIAKTIAVKHGPEILVGLGLAGMVTSTVTAVRVTPKALEKIDDAITEKNDAQLEYIETHDEEQYHAIESLTKMETVKVCWKLYLPAIITGVTSVACIIGGTSINLRRNAALATAYKISETTIKDLQEYKNKVVETIGQEKNKEIEEKIDKDHLEKAVLNMDSTVISGTGPILYFDRMGGQWFRSDKESIREVFNNLNHVMNTDMYVSLNDFYDEMGMPHTLAGDELGWNSDAGMIEARFNPSLTKNGVPVVVLSTKITPRSDFSKLM